ncbi:MAG TPA: EAL domain-containing protein [Thermoanaerobaculia bacterium]|jgi:EAL domain-containing protein (putative c-di-GMP-specific phosphodiesterase class I)
MIHDTLDRWFHEDAVTVLFQPIIRTDASMALHSVEALTRGPRGTQFEDAAVFFDYLRQTKQEIRADRRCVAAAIKAVAEHGGVKHVSINIHPTTLERDKQFAGFLETILAKEKFEATRITFEIIEESRYWSPQALGAAVRELRSLGVTIALDDVGVGRCGYRTILDVAPDILKIDRYFVDGCAVDHRRRAVVDSVRRLADDIGAVVIAEGVEREDDFSVIRGLGIPYAQGYLFSRPRPLAEVMTMKELTTS